MPSEIVSEADLSAIGQAPVELPVWSVAELLALNIAAPEMLVESMISRRGASLINGASKSGKTLFAAQVLIAVASGKPLFDQYRVLAAGPVLMIEQDDPAATASVKEILKRSPVPVIGIPFYLIPKLPFVFGPELIAWLEGEIVKRSLRAVVLDSYTALRGSRPKGGDIVKAEQEDLSELDALGKRTDCAILIIHHASKGSAALDWSQQAAGSFAMSAATESQIFVSRFSELDGAAPERLIRIRGRHSEDLEMVLRFRKETLDYEYVLTGGAAPLYPLLLQIGSAFGSQTFGPKELCHATGVSRATAHRQIDRLYRAGALSKRSFGEYAIDWAAR